MDPAAGTFAEEPRARPRRAVELGFAAALALVCFLPFARGVLGGGTFYYRDISRHFFPVRKFAIEGLRSGQLRFWNPYVHEGEPLGLPPVSYPLDALQIFASDDRGLSLLLALHVPLAALTFVALARAFGLSLAGAAAGALVYALGGFTLSCLNLYFFLQAVAWAPLVVWLALRAADGPWARVAVAAAATAVALSTLGLEIVAQAFVVAVALAARRNDASRWLRLGAVGILGAGLAAPSLAVVAHALQGGEREQGFTTAASLTFSLHPVTFLQTVVAGLYGPTSSLTYRFLGTRFSEGFPYLLSLYLGAAALVLACVGAVYGRVARRRLVLVALVAAIVCLGRHAHLDLLLEALPALRSFRFPSKAFFSVHLAVSLLSAAGLDALAGAAGRAWRSAGALAIGLGGILAAMPALPWLLPGISLSLATLFLPVGYADPAGTLNEILADASAGGALAMLLAPLALCALKRWLAPSQCAVLALVVVAADLLRAGAGLNPMAPMSRLGPSATARSLATLVRSSGGRLFTCEPAFSFTFRKMSQGLSGEPDVWVVQAYAETLVPAHNLRYEVPTAFSRDLGGIVSTDRVFQSPQELGCAYVPAILDRLRAAGVSDLVSFVPLDVPGLRRIGETAPPTVPPLRYYVHALDNPLPLRSVASMVRSVASRDEGVTVANSPGFRDAGGVAVEGGPSCEGVRGSVVSVADASDRVELQVSADRPTVVIVRDAFAPGWTATVGDAPAPVLRADGRYKAVPIPAGDSRVVLSYAPPGLGGGLAVGGMALAGVLLLGLSRRARRSDV